MSTLQGRRYPSLKEDQNLQGTYVQGSSWITPSKLKNDHIDIKIMKALISQKKGAYKNKKEISKDSQTSIILLFACLLKH